MITSGVKRITYIFSSRFQIIIAIILYIFLFKLINGDL
jgi:hypothetical protein